VCVCVSAHCSCHGCLAGRLWYLFSYCAVLWFMRCACQGHSAFHLTTESVSVAWQRCWQQLGDSAAAWAAVHSSTGVWQACLYLQLGLPGSCICSNCVHVCQLLAAEAAAVCKCVCQCAAVSGRTRHQLHWLRLCPDDDCAACPSMPPCGAQGDIHLSPLQIFSCTVDVCRRHAFLQVHASSALCEAHHTVGGWGIYITLVRPSPWWALATSCMAGREGAVWCGQCHCTYGAAAVLSCWSCRGAIFVLCCSITQASVVVGCDLSSLWEPRTSLHLMCRTESKHVLSTVSFYQGSTSTEQHAAA
jgi:hypothetical protein